MFGAEIEDMESDGSIEPDGNEEPSLGSLSDMIDQHHWAAGTLSDVEYEHRPGCLTEYSISDTGINLLAHKRANDNWMRKGQPSER